MGTVYRARRSRPTGAVVAVKILNGRELREAPRFEQEAAILAELSHPAIVRYSPTASPRRASASSRWSGSRARTWRRGSSADAGHRRRRAGRGSPRRRGAGLRARARHRPPRRQAGEPVPAGAATIARLKVLDFGIARLTQRRAQADAHRRRSIGTPGYMAPEQVRGDRDITPARRRVLAGLRAVPVPDRARRCSRPRRRRRCSPRSCSRTRRACASCVPRAAAGARRAGRAHARQGARATGWPTRAAVIAALDALGPIAGRRAPAPRAAGACTPALTDSEQRIACVVLAGPSATTTRAALARGRDRAAGGDEEDEAAVPPGELRRLEALEDELAARARRAAAPAARRLGGGHAARRRQGDRSGGARRALRAGACAPRCPTSALVVVDRAGALLGLVGGRAR